MPDMNGYEATKEIGKSKYHYHTQSAFGLNGDRKALLQDLMIILQNLDKTELVHMLSKYFT
jgi:hypothetical protein